MRQKHFIDIKHAILQPTGLIESNTQGFHLGDLVVIQEKIDGANACVKYDPETNSLACFSRKIELSYSNTLRGFWNLVQQLDKSGFEGHPDWYVFGEMLVRHTIQYDDDRYGKWYVYDIYDAKIEQWLRQAEVEQFCRDSGLEYVHTYYSGPFRGWEHVQSFMNQPGYGKQIEGVVIKNQSTLNDHNNHCPSYLKLVNPQFKEIKKSNHVRKILDPQKQQEKALAQEIVDTIVTKPRVRKMLWSLIDEGILPGELKPEDMRTVVQNLPKRVYSDCVKEHEDLVCKAGEYFNKTCNSKVMRYAREIVLGES